MRDETTGSRWVLHGREEDSSIHDEVGMRHYYAEWSRRMGRLASEPFSETDSDVRDRTALRVDRT